MNKLFAELDQIQKCYDFIKENTSEFKDNDDVLLILDIDNTITYTNLEGVFWPNIEKYYDIYKDIQDKYSDIDVNLVFLEIILTSEVKIFDDNIYKLVNDLKCKKIALTATMTGSFLNCNKIEEFRYNQLKNFNITFENEFIVNDEIIFDNFPQYIGSYPSYYKGILFSNSEKGSTNKGQLLNEFLQRVNYNPKCIILVDDNIRNHEYVGAELEKCRNDVKFISILYTGAYNYCPRDISEEDFRTFWENKFILTRKEKQKRLSKNSTF